MESINGYEILDDWTITAKGMFARGKKGGRMYFVKRLLTPTYPPEFLKKSDKKSFDRNKKACDEWFNERSKYVAKLRECAKDLPQLMVPTDFFLFENKYYVVSEFITEKPMTMVQISRCTTDEKYKLMERYLEGLASIARAGIVHSDLKEDNVIVVRRGTELIPLIIDFDDGYWTGKPPNPDMTGGSPEYYSPELGRYIVKKDLKLGSTVTCSSDVFAAGLMFYQYWTGKFVPHSYKYCYQCQKDSDLRFSDVPEKLKGLLTGMLATNPSRRFEAAAALNALRTGVTTVPIAEAKIVKIVETSPGKFKVIKSDGSYSIMSGTVAEYMSKMYKIGIKKLDVPEPPADVKPAPGEVRKLRETDVSVTFIGSDGVMRTLPKYLFESLYAEGKL